MAAGFRVRVLIPVLVVAIVSGCGGPSGAGTRRRRASPGGCVRRHAPWPTRRRARADGSAHGEARSHAGTDGDGGARGHADRQADPETDTEADRARNRPPNRHRSQPPSRPRSRSRRRSPRRGPREGDRDRRSVRPRQTRRLDPGNRRRRRRRRRSGRSTGPSRSASARSCRAAFPRGVLVAIGFPGAMTRLPNFEATVEAAMGDLPRGCDPEDHLRDLGLVPVRRERRGCSGSTTASST